MSDVAVKVTWESELKDSPPRSVMFETTAEKASEIIEVLDVHFEDSPEPGDHFRNESGRVHVIVTGKGII